MTVHSILLYNGGNEWPYIIVETWYDLLYRIFKEPYLDIQVLTNRRIIGLTFWRSNIIDNYNVGLGGGVERYGPS